MPRVRRRFKFKSDDRIAITGQPGTGKSVFTNYLAHQIPHERLLIVDPLGQYNDFPDSCRIIPKDIDPTEEFNEIARQVMAKGNMTVFVEEAQRYMPEGKAIGDAAMAMINRGRNYGVGIVAVSQRIQHINKNFWDVAQNIVFFRPGLKTRGAYLAEFVAKDAQLAIQALPDHEFIYYSLRDDSWNKAKLTFPGNKPPETKPAPAPAEPEVETVA